MIIICLCTEEVTFFILKSRGEGRGLSGGTKPGVPQVWHILGVVREL